MFVCQIFNKAALVLKQMRHVIALINRWMEEHQIDGNYNVSLHNMTEEWACLGLAGPRSRDILQKVTTSDLANKSFPFLHARHMAIGDVPVRALRISYTGEGT